METNRGELTYRSAGVDTKEGERAVELMKQHVKKTFDSGVLTGLGSFGSLYEPDLSGIRKPVLVAGSDGVGTKLKIAFMMDRHDTVGIDCVTMCVNDILCQGAKPLFFLDYLATGKLQAKKAAEIVKGVAEGCLQAGCALVGGETAEMPGFYQDGEYDMAGFAVGIVDKDKIIDGKSVEEGDLLIGIPSSGLHSNGFSLVRKLFFDKMGLSPEQYIPELDSALGDVLLTPTRIYSKVCTSLLNEVKVHALVHITGGGFYENIPRVLPEGLMVKIKKGSWPILPIFDYISKSGNISEKEMFSTFNMGIGLIIFVRNTDADRVMELIKASGERGYIVGAVAMGESSVSISD
jgi:phosphoribosylformylglycinamidine cyclo-ligase